MLYFIEIISGEDIKNPVEVIKIGYTSNFKRRLRDFEDICCTFKVIKTLRGRDFNKDHEAILHNYFKSKMFLDREGFFVKDDELISVINGLNTVDDILKLLEK